MGIEFGNNCYYEEHGQGISVCSLTCCKLRIQKYHYEMMLTAFIRLYCFP